MLIAMACAAGLSNAHAADEARQADVARRGAEVMPFDLSRTTHVFTTTTHGGTQRVVARNAKDALQVRLVREHLHEIEAQFRRGDFSGPTTIHGDAMPGLAELKAAPPGAIAIRYSDVKGGVVLTFTAADPRLVHALHRWFDAQVDDHGHHAMKGHEPPR
ncbi:MAG: aspartate carbamoyltransferase [Caldimonas sp.]